MQQNPQNLESVQHILIKYLTEYCDSIFRASILGSLSVSAPSIPEERDLIDISYVLRATEMPPEIKRTNYLSYNTGIF
jgi:hypothetical protein